MRFAHLRPGDRIRLASDAFRPPTTATVMFREVTDDGSVLYQIQTDGGLIYGAFASEIEEVLP